MSRHVIDDTVRAAWLDALEALPLGWRGTVADIAARAGIDTDPRDWGGLTTIAKSAGFLVAVGFAHSTRPTARHSAVRLWVRVQPRPERRAS